MYAGEMYFVCLPEADFVECVSFVFTPAVTVGVNSLVGIFACLLHQVILPVRYYTDGNV